VTGKFALRAHCRQDVCAPSVPWRVFCAVEIPEQVRAQLLRHIARLRESAPDARASWSRDSNLHLTLKFLGEIPRASVTNLSTAASLATVRLQPFTIRVEHTGVFPKPNKAQVLWIGINDVAGKLNELHVQLESECAKFGFEKDTRPFHPHLTIARLRHPQFARTLASAHLALDFSPVEVVVSELLVIRSELSSAGSKYTAVSRHELGE
jgi:RNA 2',3'-cyclic 3'-phosphodiesterase